MAVDIESLLDFEDLSGTFTTTDVFVGLVIGFILLGSHRMALQTYAQRDILHPELRPHPHHDGTHRRRYHAHCGIEHRTCILTCRCTVHHTLQERSERDP